LGFLRRLRGGETPREASTPRPPDSQPPGTDAYAPDATDADERLHELELLRGEQERLDALAQRQLRYAQYAWQPPPQGGERRADDHDAPRG
jgi:hypothetical protein